MNETQRRLVALSAKRRAAANGQPILTEVDVGAHEDRDAARREQWKTGGGVRNSRDNPRMATRTNKHDG